MIIAIIKRDAAVSFSALDIVSKEVTKNDIYFTLRNGQAYKYDRKDDILVKDLDKEIENLENQVDKINDAEARQIVKDRIKQLKDLDFTYIG